MDRMHESIAPARPAGCGCCGMSRRCFLGAMASGAAALATTGCSSLNSIFKDVTPNAVIDLGAMRPRPKVRIIGVTARAFTPYWLGWPGSSYPLESERQRYTQIFQEAARRVGVEYEEVAQSIELPPKPKPTDTSETLEAFIRKIKAEKPDAVFIHLQHLSAGWKESQEIAKAGIPVIVYSPVGTSFTGHVNSLGWKPGCLVISSMDAGRVEQAFRAVRAKRQFEQTKLLRVAGAARTQSVIEGLGTTLVTVPREAMEQAFQDTPENEEAKAVANWRFGQARKIKEPTRQDGINAARSFIAAKRLLLAEGCNAITTDCLGMVTQRKVPTPPCMSASIFQDAGVTYGCEAAVNPALSLMLTSYLLDQPGFMNDPVPETEHNTLIASHCVSATHIYGLKNKKQAPFIMRSHSESNIGVSPQVLWPEREKVTLALFQTPTQLIIDTGTVVRNLDTPPAGGCRTSVEIAMDRVEDSRNVLGFHQVVCWGDHRKDLQDFAQLWGIEAIHSPEHATDPAKLAAPAAAAAPAKPAPQPAAKARVIKKTAGAKP